jgi:hypothetical protein
MMEDRDHDDRHNVSITARPKTVFDRPTTN